ncbi:MAG: hypothetical protein GWP60_10120 [Gammaproteobacteria bacterium]|jgi:hypothetical protein|nr:hypothetical protein [Gammaproteobacteria bacterium]
MRKIGFLCSALLLPLFSCSVGELIVAKGAPDAALAADPHYGYSVFFRAYDNPWVGRSRDELLAALGPPDAMYEARHRFADFDAGIPAITYVYAGAAGFCLDAYVVDEPTRTVIKYYCR